MILCCGECLIDMLPRKSEEHEECFAPHAGGAVFNTAVALGRLGADAGFFSGISNDLFGDVLADALAKSNVDHRFAKRSDRPTTLAFVRLVDGHASYAFYDENTAGRMITKADLPTLPDDVNALFFGGISLVAEPAADAYAAFMHQEAAHRVCMIDPNIRPSFIADEPRYRARVSSMMQSADIIKISDEDLAWLAAGRADDDVVAELIANGTRLVCVTQGAKGITAHTAKGQIFVPATKASVIDTVGAGDTFNAGLLHGLEQGGLLSKAALADIAPEDVADAIAFGAKVAAITVSRAGANPPWASELS